MIAAPWYLLSGGIALVILGYFLAALGSRGSSRTFIDPRLSDKEIARRMRESQASPLGSLVSLLGLLAIFVSIVWRLVRLFL